MTAWTVESLRAFEEEVRYTYLQGRIRAPVHLSRGNEKQLIEIFKAVRPGDYVFSTYRSHYDALLQGVPRELVLAQIVVGHSIHLTFPEFRFFSSAIVAGNLPIALGVALGIKRRGQTNVVWCFSGEMASQTGAFHEAVKYARGFNLPIIFIIACNEFSTNSPTNETWGIPHQHITIGSDIKREYFDGWNNGGVIRYCYEREFPHYGVGVRVDFNHTDNQPAQERPDVMA